MVQAWIPALSFPFAWYLVQCTPGQLASLHTKAPGIRINTPDPNPRTDTSDVPQFLHLWKGGVGLHGLFNGITETQCVTTAWLCVRMWTRDA